MEKSTQNRILSGVMVTALLAVTALPAGAALVKKTLEIDSGITVRTGETVIKPTDAKGNAVEVFSSSGTTYLPVRAVSGALGQTVSYDGKTNTVYLGADTSDPKDAAYLNAYFSIAPFSGTVSRADFDAAIVKLGGSKTDGTGTLTLAEAVKAAVGAAGMNELALTYTSKVAPGKAAQRLSAYGVTGVSDAYASYVAAALDFDLAFPGWSFSTAPDAATITTLLMNAAQVSGQARHYLGNASDPDIYEKMQNAFQSFTLFHDEKLDALGAELLRTGASTGYNLKYDGYNANFLPEYTMTYVNSDIFHGMQLIALLNSAGLDAKIQLEPKSSMWLNTDYEDKTDAEAQQGGVEVVGSTENKKDFYGLIVAALEYDMSMEFNTVADKEAFDAIVDQYAKKYKVNQNSDGSFSVPLIRNSEWHPVYFSSMPVSTGGFKLIKDNVVRNGDYTIHPFSLTDKTAPIAKVVKDFAPDLKVELTDLYINAAFYRYLTASGED